MRKFYTSSATFLLITMLGFIGCSKNDPAPVICYLTKSILVSNSTMYSETLTYDDKNHVISIHDEGNGPSSTATFVYGSNGNLTTADFGGGFGATYAFDANNRMIQRTFTPDGGVLTLTYNASGQNTSRTFVDPNCPTCGYTMTYTYPNTTTHNYTTEEYQGSTSTYTTSYEYDSHPNPFKPVLYSSTGSDNNVTKATTAGSPAITYTYTYNDKGYPLTVTSSSGSTTTYTYNCK